MILSLPDHQDDFAVNSWVGGLGEPFVDSGNVSREEVQVVCIPEGLSNLGVGGLESFLQNQGIVGVDATFTSPFSKDSIGKLIVFCKGQLTIKRIQIK